jgi:hypothetical protein
MMDCLSALEKRLFAELKPQPASEAERNQILERVISIYGATMPSTDTEAAATTSPHPERQYGGDGLQPNLSLPSAQTTWAYVQKFFGSSNELFHVFSPEQMESYYNAVFSADGKADTTQKLAICCLCTVAAIGARYNPDSSQPQLAEIFHNASRYYLTDAMEKWSLESIKVCTLHALYHRNKTTAALPYVSK